MGCWDTLVGHITFSIQYVSLTTGEISDLTPYSMVYRFVTAPLIWVLFVVHIILAATLVSRIKEGKNLCSLVSGTALDITIIGYIAIDC